LSGRISARVKAGEILPSESLLAWSGGWGGFIGATVPLDPGCPCEKRREVLKHVLLGKRAPPASNAEKKSTAAPKGEGSSPSAAKGENGLRGTKATDPPGVTGSEN